MWYAVKTKKAKTQQKQFSIHGSLVLATRNSWPDHGESAFAVKDGVKTGHFQKA